MPLPGIESRAEHALVALCAIAEKIHELACHERGMVEDEGASNAAAIARFELVCHGMSAAVGILLNEPAAELVAILAANEKSQLTSARPRVEALEE